MATHVRNNTISTTAMEMLHNKLKSKLLYDWQSVSMSWYRELLWDLRPDIISCRNVTVWNLRSIIWGLPLWWEDGSAICSVITQWSESLRPVIIFYCLIWDSPNLEGQVPVFISPRNRVVQLYPRAVGSLYVVSYDSTNTCRLVLLRNGLSRERSLFLLLRWSVIGVSSMWEVLMEGSRLLYNGYRDIATGAWSWPLTSN
jgi:hypothetical protein